MSAGDCCTVRAFESAYPGSMFERKDGCYVERDDHKSMAAALVELIAARDRELDDLRDAVKSYQRLLDAAPHLVDALRAAYSDIQRLPGHTIDMLGRIEAALAKAGGAS